MAYSADSFVADEQPTTAKWNKLWSNDASFNDGTGIATGAITSAKISGFDYSLATTNSNPYKFSAYHNTTQNSGSGAFAQGSFNTELFDTNSNFASNAYTAPVAGFYIIGSRIHTTGSPTRFIVSLFKNGTEIARGGDFAASTAGTTAGTGVEATRLLQLAASDVMTSQSFGNTTLTIAAGTNGDCHSFWGILQSRT